MIQRFIRPFPSQPLLRHTSLVALLLATALTAALPARSTSALLETVKKSPALARQMCADFRKLNAQGQSATSKASIAAVASAQGLSEKDAEVLMIYVIGLHCSEVF